MGEKNPRRHFCMSTEFCKLLSETFESPLGILLRHPSGAQNFKMTHRFMENLCAIALLCILGNQHFFNFLRNVLTEKRKKFGNI
jgi:hypothetical protein